MSEKTYYRGSLDGFAYYEASNDKKTPTFEFKFIVDEVKQGSEYAGIEAKIRSVYCYLTDARVEAFSKELALIGFDVATQPLETLDDWVEQNKGKRIALSMKTEEYQGKTKERWELASDYTPRKTDVTGLKGVSKKFGSLLKAVAPNASGKKPAVTVPDNYAQQMADGEIF